MRHIVTQLKKCGNKIVTLFIIVFENVHFSGGFFLAGREDFTAATAAFCGLAFDLPGRDSLVWEVAAVFFFGVAADFFLAAGFVDVPVAVRLGFPGVFPSVSGLLLPWRVGHSELLHSATAG